MTDAVGMTRDAWDDLEGNWEPTVLPPDTVGAAWLAAEDSLPSGWIMRGVWRSRDHWNAQAGRGALEWMSAQGDSAPAALRALAARLRERPA